jgi:hypothetical protein
MRFGGFAYDCLDYKMASSSFLLCFVKAGSNYVSRSITNTHAVPTIIPRFTGSTDSTDSSSTPADVNRHPKCKMATAKQEIVVSHDLQQMDTMFQRLYPDFLCGPTRLIMHENPPRCTKYDGICSNSAEIYSTSGSAVAIFRLGCRWTLAGVGDESAESGDPEKLRNVIF